MGEDSDTYPSSVRPLCTPAHFPPPRANYKGRGFRCPRRDNRHPPDHPPAEEGAQQQRRRVRARGAGALPRVWPGAERPPGRVPLAVFLPLTYRCRC